MDRLYRCKNKQHYIFATARDDAIWCEFCNKIYTFDECDIINKKTGKSWSRIPNQPLVS